MLAASSGAAEPPTLVALTESGVLLVFPADRPGAATEVSVRELDGSLVGIDLRPADQRIYGLATTNQVYTIVIFGDVRKKLGFNPEESKYAGGIAIVTGKVELYKDKPQIVITDPAQLQILNDAGFSNDQLPPMKKN